MVHARPPQLEPPVLLTKSEVPAFIPRADLMQQMTRWAEMEAAEKGRTVYGVHMAVEPVTTDEGLALGFKVTMGDDNNVIVVKMDEGSTEKFQFIKQDMETGMPKPGGAAEEVEGKFFEIWKVDLNDVAPETKAAIKLLCQSIAQAFDKYYAFGSVFLDDTT